MQNKGESPYAEQVPKMWTGKKRPRKFRGKVHGLVVHTTGAGLPSKALDRDQDITDRAKKHYLNTHGTHYLNTYDGSVFQVANEIMRANGVGMKEQEGIVKDVIMWETKSFKNDDAEAIWYMRWFFNKSPLDLFPGTSANACYVHMEMPPCIFWHNNKLHTVAEPMREGLRFTKAQHDSVVRMSVDIADRNKLSMGWQFSGSLVGHEDLSPVSRVVKSGGYDPGALRKNPWFDWDYVYKGIQKLNDAKLASELELEIAEEAVQKQPPGPSPVETVSIAFIEWVKKLLGIKD